jgi:LacI family transcriptional regulator
MGRTQQLSSAVREVDMTAADATGAATPGRRPTMRDVADEAGVGLATVSRVVNGVGNVNEATAERVRDVIGRLGFQRDEIARSLRPGQNSLTIGLKLGDLTNPFWSHLAKGAVAEARRQGYAVLVGTSDEDPAVERRSIDDLLARRVAGLVLSPDARDHSYLMDATGRTRVPLVFVDRPAKGAQADSVVFDNEGGGRLATEHLLAAGHRRIGIVVAPSYYTTGHRLRGYRKALREAGISVERELIAELGVGSVGEAADATRRLLELPDPPTAIFSTTNFLTEGVLRALGPRHSEIALVGFDDFHLAALLPTPVTVVATDTEELGRTSAELLLRRIAGSEAPRRRLVLPVTLVARGSGELPPRSASRR